jgi:phage gp36-like protein
MTAYATIRQLRALGINADALARVSPEDQELGLEAASRIVDSYLWELEPPLAVFTGEISTATAIIAAYHLLAASGFDPEHDDSKNVRLRYLDQIEWLKGLKGGSLLVGAVGQGAVKHKPVGPRVRSEPLRGWHRGFRGKGAS